MLTALSDSLTALPLGGSVDVQAGSLAVVELGGMLLSLGLNRVGPRDGLYVLEGDNGYRIYVQERGVPLRERRDLSFDDARTTVIDELVLLNGIPFSV